MLKKITNVVLALVLIISFSTPIATAEQEEELDIVTSPWYFQPLGISGLPAMAMLVGKISYYSNQGYVGEVNGFVTYYKNAQDFSLDSFQEYCFADNMITAYCLETVEYSHPMISGRAIWVLWGDADANTGHFLGY